MLPLLHDYCLEHWHDLPVIGRKPKRLTFLGQATGVSKVCFFVFGDNDRRPRAIIKMPRSPVFNASLMDEVATIQRLRDLVSPALQTTLPGPMHTAQVAGQQIVIEPVLRGRPLDSRQHPADRAATEAQFALAHRWLIQMQQAADPLTTALDASAIQHHILEPLDDVRRNTDLTPTEARYLEGLADQSRQLIGCSLPFLLYHGDFRAGNILADGDGIAVLDWEFSRPLAPPLLDWFSFVFRVYSRAIDLPDIDGARDHYRAAFHEVFFAHNWFSRLVSEYTRSYCRELSIDDTYIPLLFGLFVTTNISKFYSFLQERARRGYLYLLQDNARSGQPFQQQLRRQAYTWLLGELASHAEPPIVALR
jgi:hypothetical protein